MMQNKPSVAGDTESTLWDLRRAFSSSNSVCALVFEVEGNIDKEENVLSGPWKVNRTLLRKTREGILIRDK